MTLDAYQKKRNFTQTREPPGKVAKTGRQRFVVQEHHASQLHYDFRLEMGGVLKSWAIPKGPSLDPNAKRLAVQVEDHPVDYLLFEGEIAEGNYGAGRVVVWDTGAYTLEPADPLGAYADGKLSFVLNGDKLRGRFTLIQMKSRPKQWLLLKSRDQWAQEGWELEPILPQAKPGPARRMRSRKTSDVQPPAAVTPPRKKTPPVGKTPTRRATMSLSQFAHAGALEGDIHVHVDGQEVSLTHLDKLYWPQEGITKGDLLRYYARMAETILPYLQHRPLILKRYPDGIAASFFFQHDLPHAPDFVRTEILESHEERAIEYAVIDNTATLLYLTNLGTIEEHPWHSRVEDRDHPDWVVFDLDPEEAEFDVVCQVAQAVRRVLDEWGLSAYAKTSGSRGLHILVPIEPRYRYDETARFAEHVASRVARENPQTATVVRSLSRRKRGRVYVDHLQNAQGKTIVAPYSVRARVGATVSAPLDWREVKPGLNPGQFTLSTLPARLSAKGDLFKGVLAHSQNLDEALQQIERRARAVSSRPTVTRSP